MLHTKYLPEYHFNELHRISVAATPSVVYESIVQLDLSGSFVSRILLSLRGMPSRPGQGIAEMEKFGFVHLESTTDRELIFGLIGQFWKPHGNIQKVTAEEFVSFANPEFAKVTWNFEILPEGPDSTVVTTETRILCLNEKARNRFGRYWFFIRPFSGIIRMELLKTIRKVSEANAKVENVV